MHTNPVAMCSGFGIQTEEGAVRVSSVHFHSLPGTDQQDPAVPSHAPWNPDRGPCGPVSSTDN